MIPIILAGIVLLVIVRIITGRRHFRRTEHQSHLSSLQPMTPWSARHARNDSRIFRQHRGF